MTTNKRDRLLISYLEKFRCLDTSLICDLVFHENANPRITANRVLRRLRLNQQISVDTDQMFRDYVYFPINSTVKQKSQKIPHYLKIARSYLKMLKLGSMDSYDVEVKIPGTSFRCDALATNWIDNNWFIEYQNSLLSYLDTQKKVEKYYSYFKSEEWKDRFERFPNILILGKNNMKFSADDYPDMKITCIKSFKELEPSIKAYQSRKLERVVKEAKEIKQPTRANREVSEGIKSSGGKITFKL